MFLSLPPEVQFDVLKCLNFEQLFSVKQINFYFRNLIEKYEGSLARMEFLELSLISAKYVNNEEMESYEFIKLEPEVSDFVLDDHLMEKWKTAVDKFIPLFLQSGVEGFFEDKHLDVVEDFAVQLIKPDNEKHSYILKLPNYPKSFEMVIIQFWLKQLSNCAFEKAGFKNIFNPAMIDLLFDNDGKTSLQFHIQAAVIGTNNDKFENCLKFGLNHCAVYKTLMLVFMQDDVRDKGIFGVCFLYPGHIPSLFHYSGVWAHHISNILNWGSHLYYDDVDILEQYTDILFNIIINEGDKFPRVTFGIFKLTRLYDRVVEYITTSKDFSKMVPIVDLICDPSEIKLPESAENVEEKGDSTKYQIFNIYDPKVKFQFYQEGDWMGTVSIVNMDNCLEYERAMEYWENMI
uniref:F-box domain-containing protein n=1 Tax=Meloidogyne enterolobii TaxID=390850 RepID=A0A6V7V710_MELEN|nr:unnamed protein product [Meloidogyne enterolobii]